MILEDLSKQIGQVLAENKIEIAPSFVANKLPKFLRKRTLLTKKQKMLPASGYGRHNVYICPQKYFSIIVAVWPPCFTSVIHDHETWCAFGVFEGHIKEHRYPMASRLFDVNCFETCELSVGQTSYMSAGTAGIHSIQNATDKVAISLHVYGGDAEKMGPNVANVYGK